MRWIAQNASFAGSIVGQNVRDANGRNEGFDAKSATYEDLIKAGVIDPTKDVRTAFQNAGSIASLLLTTDALVETSPKRRAQVPRVPA